MTRHSRETQNPALPCTLFIVLALLVFFVAFRAPSVAQAQETELNLAAAAATPALQPRQFATIAHDSVHHQFLLFGGTYGSQRFADTWLLTSSGWTALKLPAHPSARISSATVYDSLHNQFVLFGGRVQEARPAACSPGAAPAHLKNEYFCADTWVCVGLVCNQKTPASSPSAREGHAMAFDAARNQVVLFGGTAASTSLPLSDTWLWNGTTWKQVFPAHSPPARLWHSMAYDPVHKNVLLFGGDAGTQFINDTWTWNGTDWQMADPQPAGPPLRTGAGLDYDPASGTMVLFSGTAWNTKRVGAVALDSWSWNGTQWKQIAPAKFTLISDFTELTSAQLATSILAGGTPSVLWTPVK